MNDAKNTSIWIAQWRIVCKHCTIYAALQLITRIIITTISDINRIFGLIKEWCLVLSLCRSHDSHRQRNTVSRARHKINVKASSLLSIPSLVLNTFKTSKIQSYYLKTSNKTYVRFHQPIPVEMLWHSPKFE